MYFNPKTSVKRRMYYSLALKRGFRATGTKKREKNGVYLS